MHLELSDAYTLADPGHIAWQRGARPDRAGRPGPERFGLAIAPEGTHTPWLDTPDNPVPVRG
ncbi:hypothetical protein [Streptomyces californicus]|uniref:hypothetical protein n=1 Tax=Streptomyces californicus TaxID=67351 RepID=UPI0036C91DAD